MSLALFFYRAREMAREILKGTVKTQFTVFEDYSRQLIVITVNGSFGKGLRMVALVRRWRGIRVVFPRTKGD